MRSPGAALGWFALGMLAVGLLEGCSSMKPGRPEESILDVVDRISHERRSGGQGECPADLVRVCAGSFHAALAMSCGCSSPDQVQSAFSPLYK